MTGTKSFLKSLPITAAAFGRTFGVDVFYGGAVPKTDGRCIVLPEVGDEIEERTVLAWLGHECGHVLATNFRALRCFAPVIVLEITNALEDPRVEREIGREFGGMRFILRGFYDETVRDLLRNHRNRGHESLSPGQTLSAYVLVKGEHLLFGESCFEEAVGELRRSLVHYFGEKIADAVDAEVGKLPGFKSTKSCVDCAQRIYDFIREEGRSLELSADQPSESSSSKDDADSSGETLGEGRAQNAVPSPSVCMPSPEDASQKEAGAEGGKTKADDGSAGHGEGQKSVRELSNAERAGLIRALDKLVPKDFDQVPDLSRTIGEALSAAARRYRRKGKGKVGIARRAVPARPIPEPYQKTQTDAYRKGQQMIEQAKKDCVGMRRELKRFVESQTRRRGWTAASGLRLSSSTLSRLAVNNPRVFERRIEKRGIDTAVHILVDFSGSMRETTHGEKNAEIAMRAALALFSGFSGLRRVNPAVSIFRDSAFTNLVPHGAKRPESYAGAIGSAYAMGGTPLDTAVVDADLLLQQARANRRITIVITDGDPNDFIAAGQAIKALEDKGSEFFAIGIGRNAPVSLLFKHSKTIETIDDLPAALFEGAKILIGKGIRA